LHKEKEDVTDVTVFFNSVSHFVLKKIRMAKAS